MSTPSRQKKIYRFPAQLTSAFATPPQPPPGDPPPDAPPIDEPDEVAPPDESHRLDNNRSKDYFSFAEKQPTFIIAANCSVGPAKLSERG